MDNKTIYLNIHFFVGNIQDAIYTDQIIEDYKGNPFLEALPPILSVDEAKIKLRNHPYYCVEERQLPAYLRLHCVERISDFVEPLSRAINLEQCISRMIRYGYKSRNPMTINYVKQLNLGSEAIKSKDIAVYKEKDYIRSTASGLIILGISGAGKTTDIESVLKLYPQVIVHKNYKERKFYLKQLVWIKLDCPHDGSIKGLCINFFIMIDRILGTDYYKKFGRGKTTEQMIPEIGHVATLHGLGALVIDEIQNLDQAKSGGSEKMINFFVELINTIGVPVILIGTLKAQGLFTGVFRDSRRVSGEIDGIWDKYENDNEFKCVVEGLWKYQWTKNIAPLSPEIINSLYEESQGILDIVVKIYKLAQWRAIASKREIVDIPIIKSVAKDSLKLIKPMLDALKSRNKDQIKQYSDLHISAENMQNAKKVYTDTINKLNNAKSLEKSLLAEKYESDNQLISEVSSWLIQSGYPSEKSLDIATRVAKDNKDKDITKLRQEAFIMAYNESNTEKLPVDPEPENKSFSQGKYKNGRNKASKKENIETLKKNIKTSNTIEFLE